MTRLEKAKKELKAIIDDDKKLLEFITTWIMCVDIVSDDVAESLGCHDEKCPDYKDCAQCVRSWLEKEID